MHNNLVWFRNDLRVSDNTVLLKACQTKGKVIAVYCFDPRHYSETTFGFPKTGKYRAQFLIETVINLKETLSALNITLIVSTEKPEHILPKAIKENTINTVYYQREWTQEELDVQELVEENSKHLEVSFKSFYDQFLFHPSDIPYSNSYDIPRVFTQFRKQLEKYSKVRQVLPKPELREKDNLLNSSYSIPSLSDLGLETFETNSKTAFPFQGGEVSALKRLQDYHWITGYLSNYKETRNGLVGKNYSSKYSAWLANGSISARTIYWDVKQFEKERESNQSTYWMVFELLWRDFFKYVSMKHGNSLFKIGGILEKEYNWSQHKATLKAWINGTTKYDFVNANMIELRDTGWMSNRGRQNVASYWAKELQQDWRIGASYFESLLIDYDVHSNYGNWMYNSGVGNDPRDRKFNIESQAERYDQMRTYRDLWLGNTLF